MFQSWETQLCSHPSFHAHTQSINLWAYLGQRLGCLCATYLPLELLINWSAIYSSFSFILPPRLSWGIQIHLLWMLQVYNVLPLTGIDSTNICRDTLLLFCVVFSLLTSQLGGGESPIATPMRMWSTHPFSNFFSIRGECVKVLSAMWGEYPHTFASWGVCR